MTWKTLCMKLKIEGNILLERGTKQFTTLTMYFKDFTQTLMVGPIFEMIIFIYTTVVPNTKMRAPWKFLIIDVILEGSYFGALYLLWMLPQRHRLIFATSGRLTNHSVLELVARYVRPRIPCKRKTDQCQDVENHS